MSIAEVAADGGAPARRGIDIVLPLPAVPGRPPFPLILRAGLPVLCVAALCALTFDPVLAHFMKMHVAGDFARAARAISDLGIGTGYVVMAALSLAGSWLPKRSAVMPLFDDLFDRVRRFARLFLLSLAASGAVIHAIKFLAGRHRPRDLFDQAAYGFEPFMFHRGLDSFPSGHSQTIFAVATVLCLAMPKRWRSFSLAAMTVAATRVVMTNHYLSDVLVGSHIGIAAVLVIAPRILKQGDAPMLPHLTRQRR